MDKKAGMVRRARWSPQKLRSMSCFWRAPLLGTACDLQLFDWLARSDRSAKAASDHFGGTAQGWEIFLNALVAMGLLRKRGGRFRNSHFTLQYLCFGKGDVLLPAYDAWNSWKSLPTVLTTGDRPQVAQPFLTHRKHAERLLQALDHDGRLIAPYLVRRLQLKRANKLLDVGGGLGTYTLACCRRFPHLRATLVEHPRIVSLARRTVKESGLAHRVEVLGLDIVTDPWPVGFDIVLVSNVLHGQGVADNRAVISSAYHSLDSQGRLVLRDVFLGQAGTDPEWGALFSVALLVQTPRGRCYSLKEVQGWLRDAGFAKISGPFPSSPLYFDPDRILIAQKT